LILIVETQQKINYLIGIFGEQKLLNLVDFYEFILIFLSA